MINKLISNYYKNILSKKLERTIIHRINVDVKIQSRKDYIMILIKDRRFIEYSPIDKIESDTYLDIIINFDKYRLELYKMLDHYIEYKVKG